MSIKKLLFIALSLASALAQASDLSLAQIKANLEGKTVVVLGEVFPSFGEIVDKYNPTANKMVSWKEVEGGPEQGYRELAYKHAPSSLKGQYAKVVGVQLAKGLAGRNSPTRDVFGKELAAGSEVNPYFTVFVRTEDGDKLYATTGYYSTVVGRSLLTSEMLEKNRAQIGGFLGSIQGKTLYKMGYTVLSQDNADFATLKRRSLMSGDNSVPNLTPLKVAEGKYFEAENAAVIKVMLPDGATRLIYCDTSRYDVNGEGSMYDKLWVRAVEKVPAKFTPKELQAIKNEDIFRGMSKEALYASWGYPEKTNDWGRGGKQHIYGSQYVYILNDKITDWQQVR